MNRDNRYMHVSKKVEAFIGPKSVDVMYERAGEYVCCKCGNKGNAKREDTSVVVVTQDNAYPQLSQAHMRCMSSIVVKLPGRGNGWTPPDPYGDGTNDVLSIPAVWPNREGTEYHAGLLLDLQTNGLAIVPNGSGETHDAALTAFVRLGWELVLDVYQDLVPLDRYVVNLGPGGTGSVTGLGFNDEPSILVDPLPHPDPVWIAHALRDGYVRVLMGDLNLASAPPGRPEPTIIAAIRAAKVVGARIPVRSMP